MSLQDLPLGGGGPSQSYDQTLDYILYVSPSEHSLLLTASQRLVLLSYCRAGEFMLDWLNYSADDFNSSRGYNVAERKHDEDAGPSLSLNGEYTCTPVTILSQRKV